MGRVASDQEKIDQVEKKQKNGSIYVYERHSRHDSSKGYYVSVGQKLIRKKLFGSDQIVPIRSKFPIYKVFNLQAKSNSNQLKTVKTRSKQCHNDTCPRRMYHEATTNT